MKKFTSLSLILLGYIQNSSAQNYEPNQFEAKIYHSNLAATATLDRGFYIFDTPDTALNNVLNGLSITSFHKT